MKPLSMLKRTDLRERLRRMLQPKHILPLVVARLKLLKPRQRSKRLFSQKFRQSMSKQSKRRSLCEMLLMHVMAKSSLKLMRI